MHFKQPLTQAQRELFHMFEDEVLALAQRWSELLLSDRKLLRALTHHGYTEVEHARLAGLLARLRKEEHPVTRDGVLVSAELREALEVWWGVAQDLLAARKARPPRGVVPAGKKHRRLAS